MGINNISDRIMAQCCPKTLKEEKELYSYELPCGISIIYYVFWMKKDYVKAMNCIQST